MSDKNIFINPNATTIASAIVGVNGAPTNFPELVFGDSYSFVVKFTGNTNDGYIVPDLNSQYLFNIGALTRATAGTFEIAYDGEYTESLPFNASADEIATALNSLSKIASAGGVNVSGNDGSPYRIIFKTNGARKNFEVRSNLYPDTNPIIHVVNFGDTNSVCELLIVLKLDTIASVSNYVVNESAKELRFDVSLNTVECLLALGTSDKVRLLAELKSVDANGNVFTYSQSQCTIQHRLIDVNALEYATSEIKGILTSVKAIETRMAELYSPNSIARRGEFYFRGGALQIDSLKYVQGNSFSFAVNFKANKDYFVDSTKQVSILDLGSLYLYFHASLKRLSLYAPSQVLPLVSVSDSVNDRLLNGQIHSLILTYDGTTLKLIDETGVLLSKSVTLQSQDSLYKTKIGSNLNGQLSNIKYFNFDMSADDAPYTIADYINGKDESPLLHIEQPVIEWINYGNGGTINGNSIEYNNAVSTVYPRPFGNAPVFNVGKTYEFKAIRSESNSNFRLSSTINTSDSCDVSWKRINLTTGDTYNGTSSQMRDLNVFGAGQVGEVETIVKFTPKVSGIVPYFVADTGATGSVTILYVRTDGALLSLEDYAFNGKVADVSGNNNDATIITGDVVGTKDNSIEKMYQAFASKIGNITE